MQVGMLMNILGYSQKRREARLEAYSRAAIHQYNYKEDCICTGSKVEGDASRLESEFDVMFEPRSVVSTSVRMMRTNFLPKPY
ncbi:hypothetical protein DPMN_092342 [Dreissena polymorpha]|uniref:Uncharacterized protein n=1 Tax=Dreissena polymorpha TaxID=45954 RepID=A0A9D4L1D1_DREPO|nr:hypothetical protein DPMN_092342 [Dreissena polymorpha]